MEHGFHGFIRITTDPESRESAVPSKLGKRETGQRQNGSESWSKLQHSKRAARHGNLAACNLLDAVRKLLNDDFVDGFGERLPLV